ncbi:8bc47def-46d2-40f0-b282-687707878f6d [Thermothielavioides terrestris]|uniref:8bc47def-46d2-40f0-b282-687707878f6d n=1 Tax=Thermothielavioides terrestris TaxID=2587410 RepID=A0A446B5H9_9PEZI|nr:8bc47def-46d2-40f0-b282-687707878f6d [Thermothielavioides terrestris]
MKISGRTFVVSGGASGLGRACVREICAGGGNAAILDMNEELGSTLAGELGASAKFVPCDVSDTSSVAAAVQAAVAAGLILDKQRQPLALEAVDFVLAINVRGTLDVVRQALPHLAAAAPEGADGERGVVVMVASVAAFEGQMGQVAYAASKGAVAAMTLPMARDLSRFGIRVVTVAPGPFDTAMTAVMSDKVREGLRKAVEFPARSGRPEEFAALVRHAIENVMLNGVVIRLDGASRMPSKL